MMSVTLEQIDILRERANVSYAQAKEVLEKCDGDILEAMIMLEAQAKVRVPKRDFSESGVWNTSKGFLATVKRLIKKSNETKFVISKKEKTVIDMPVTVLIIVTVFMAPLTVVGVLAAMLTNHRISFVKLDGNGMKINDTLDKVSSCVNSVGSQAAEAVKNN